MPNKLYVKNDELYCIHCAYDNVKTRLIKLKDITKNTAIVEQNKLRYIYEFKKLKGKKSKYEIKHFCLECK